MARQRDVRRCEADECNRRTRERKPFCSDHVALHPYVMELLERLAVFDDGRAGGRLDADHPLVGDALRVVVLNGGATIARLARVLNTSHAVALRAARVLQDTHEVTMRRSTRRAGRWLIEPRGGARVEALLAVMDEAA